MIDRARVLEKLDLLLQKNDYAAAKRLLQYWLEESKASGDARGILLMENELMGLCRKLGEEKEALEYAQAALDQVGAMGIDDTVGGATTFLNCATVCKAFGRWDSALDLFQMARVIYERDLDPSDDRLAGLYNNMGLALVDAGRFREANALYEKALSLLSSLEKKEAEAAITYLNMAGAAEAEFGLSRGKEKIDPLCEKARLCMEIGAERKDGGYAFACEKCASVFGFYGFEEYARTLSERAGRIYEGT